MEKQERELLIKACDLLREMADMQLTTYRAVRALSHAVQTKVPGIEEEYKKAHTESLFATDASMKVNRMIGEIEDALARLKTSTNS